MRRHLSASAITLALGIGIGSASAADQGDFSPPLPDNGARPAPNGVIARTATARMRQQAHDRTVASATRAYDTGLSASAAQCSQDRGLQARTRNAAEAALRDLSAAAQAEAELDPDVTRAHNEAFDPNFPPDSTRIGEYERVRGIKAQAIAESALRVVTTPASTNGGCLRAPQPRTAESPIPPLPATPQKSISLLSNFDDQLFKAILSQPGLRLRVETLMGLEGCNWEVDPAAARATVTRQAAGFINRMNDDDLRNVLTSNVIQDRLETVRRGGCMRAGPEFNQPTPFPVPNTANQDPGPQPYPYGYPGTNPYNGGPYNGPYTGSPYPGYPGGSYGGYNGYGPNYVPGYGR